MMPIIGRLDLNTLLESERVVVISNTVHSLLGTSFINIFFGFGPASFKYLALTDSIIRGRHSTSNNIFIDNLYEFGVVGFLCCMSLFIYLLLDSFYKAKDNKYYFISYLLTTHLIISSMYRGDYVSPRFWILLTLIILLRNIGQKILRTKL
jgi:O-antigen ligase